MNRLHFYTSSLKKYFIYLPVRAQTSLSSVRFSIAGAPPNGVCAYTVGLVFIYFLAQTKPVLHIDAKSKYLSCRILGSVEHLLCRGPGYYKFHNYLSKNIDCTSSIWKHYGQNMACTCAHFFCMTCWMSLLRGPSQLQAPRWKAGQRTSRNMQLVSCFSRATTRSS